MKLITLVGILGLLTGCGSSGPAGQNGVNGSDGVNGSPGEPGPAGQNGSPGKDGKGYAESLIAALQKIQVNSGSVLDLECISNGTRGTGTKLTDGRVLTAHHVINGCTNMQYYSGPALVGVGGSYTQDGVRDVVRISNVVWNTQGLALSGISEQRGHLPKLGDLLLTASYPLDLVDDVQITSGLVTDENFSAGGSYWAGAVITDAAAAGGSSGAPVFNDAGDLIGIHVGGWSTGGLELNIQLPLN